MDRLVQGRFVVNVAQLGRESPKRRWTLFMNEMHRVSELSMQSAVFGHGLRRNITDGRLDLFRAV